MSRKVRIGIDVGGTFTDACIIDNETGEVIAKKKLPTTHHVNGGVAEGIIAIIRMVLAEANISPSDVSFIAHGTTQATNALLEGDVACVGIIGMGDSRSAQNETDVEKLELAENKFLQTHYTFLPSVKVDEVHVVQAVKELASMGAQVIVASEAFSIEHPEHEQLVIETAQKLGYYAAGGYEISQLFGLRMRTRTAVVNGSLIPKMMETANMTEKVVKEVGIPSELMIMRADGGVMSINEVRKRPILTMLSGLAAGVAGALMYEKITEGIFMEIGGTSIDISVIKDGQVMIKNASVGGHKTYLKSLDVRTLGVAGGTMVRIRKDGSVEVGPRSAHLAGKPYECFLEEDYHGTLQIEQISPLPGDESDYVIARNEQGNTHAYTLAGAANYLGIVPAGDYAHVEKQRFAVYWDTLGEFCHMSGEEIAQKCIDCACEKILSIIKELMVEYNLQKDFVTLVGGGGSAAILTSAIAEKYNLKYKIARNAPYISTIGVAMAMIREQIERSVINPTDKDIICIRNDAIDKLLSMGAVEESIEVSIEVDAQKNVLIATATGASEFKKKDQSGNKTDDELKEIVAQSVNMKFENVRYVTGNDQFKLYEATQQKTKMLGMMKSIRRVSVVVNREGVVLYRRENGNFVYGKNSDLDVMLSHILDTYSTFSDAGQTMPELFAFCKARTYNYSGLASIEQLRNVLHLDFEYMNEAEPVMFLATKR